MSLATQPAAASQRLKLAYLTAGAAGMICGSCLHDNTLARAMIALGHDVQLIPLYTPIRTDEEDVSERRVFFGGINVYLQQKSALFRRTPWFLDRLLDVPRLLRWVSRFAVHTQADELSDLTLSMLRGDHGNQKKEIAKLSDWLVSEVRPEVIHLTNVLLSGMVQHLQSAVKAPIVASLQGDDIFLELLPENVRSEAIGLIRENCRHITAFVATSRYYADFMAGYLGIERERIHVIYPGLNLRGHGEARPSPSGSTFNIGYFARICPEKGLHILVEAFRRLKALPRTEMARLRISGYLGENNKPYLHELLAQVKSWGLGNDVEHLESPDHAGKIRFLQSLDILSVPTVYREPKGLYVLEALANGVPVVEPRHGTFPELLEMTGGGLLVKPEDPEDLARGLKRLLDNPEERTTLGQRGKEVVHARFHAALEAEQTVLLYRKLTS